MPHVFLVEDDTVIGKIVQDFFMEQGYHVTWEEHGGTAQAMLKAHAFDMLLFDFNLPKVTGLQLIQTVRGNQDNTPIIMITANETIKQACFEAGANAFFSKPVELNALLACVEGLLLPTKR